MALELGVAPFSFMPKFWAEQEAHPKSFPKGRCKREGRKNIAQSAIAKNKFDFFIRFKIYY